MNAKKLMTLAINSLSGVVPRNFLGKSRVLMYHSIYNESDGFRDNFAVSLTEFQKQIEYLVNRDDIVFTSFDNPTFYPDKYSVCITFDDGYRDNLKFAAPILKKYEIPFTIFLVTGWIDRNQSHDLTSADLKELEKMGASFGLHGNTHKPFPEIGLEEMTKELELGKEKFLTWGLKPPVTLSLPHGQSSSIILDTLQNSFLKIIGTSEMGVFDAKHSLFDIPRTPITDSDSLKNFAEKLNGHWDWYPIAKSIMKSISR